MLDSFFLGIFLKLVDEVLDKDIEVQSLYLEIFKCLTIMFLLLSTSADFPFAISTLISLGFSYIAGGIDHDYWTAFMIVSGLTCIISFSSSLVFKELTPALWLIPTFFVMPLIVYGEALIFPEDSSFTKMMGSAAMIPLLGLFYISPIVCFFKERIPITGIVEKGILFGIGYFLTRTIVKGYIIYNNQYKSSPTSSLSKEEKNKKSQKTDSSSSDSPLPTAEHSSLSDSDNSPLTQKEVQ